MNDLVKNNYTMLCDFYELTMSNGYFNLGKKDIITYFDVFFRSVPDNGGFAIAAGLEQVINYVNELNFTKDDIDFLREKNIFSEEFLIYLLNFKFTGDIYAVKEGTPIFPNEPILTVKAPAIESQFIETFILLTINHQSLIATKANRIVRAAQGRPVAEFGSRRAQGADGAIFGARASFIGGCSSSACTIADKNFGVKSSGTMAHSWVQMFDTEYESFEEYCKLYPDNPILLVDTYDVLKSGIPNAIKAFDNILRPKGLNECGIRIDSGDITYLSKKARKILDSHGYNKCKIIASNSLDEKIISDILLQGAKVDAFGVGERLITAKSSPVFGGVYKLCAIIDERGNIIPKIKISENINKITNPHFKNVYRLYDNLDGKAIADYICLHDEIIDESSELVLFDPNFVWKKKTIKDFRAVNLLEPIFIDGKCVYKSPNIIEIRDYCQSQIDLLWEELLRFENPHNYYVDLSIKLWNLKQDMLSKLRK